MTPQERRMQALAQQVRIEEAHCQGCPVKGDNLSSTRTTGCGTCEHGEELRKVGYVLNETMADMRLQRAGVMV